MGLGADARTETEGLLAELWEEMLGLMVCAPHPAVRDVLHPAVFSEGLFTT